VTPDALPPSNLPVQLTSFVGRERELDELAALLRQGRLVTVAGAPGMGKTRIAAELATRVLAEHPDGTWAVSVAALSDATELPRELAATLGAREPFSESPLDTLLAHVGSRRMLLVLDDCEHLLDACARLAEALLTACPELRILATSHEPLRVPGEQVWRIPPLTLPELSSTDERALEAVAGSEAVRLFQARASLVRPHFSITPANARTVARLCHRLDGIPLAIELAAARVEMMSVDDILDRLEDRFRLLTGGGRTVMPRHQTLRAALDWGHQLLNPAEQMLFRRLSVFASGFELGPAEAVCASADLPADQVLGHLTRLVDKSLVVPALEPAGHTRYRMLETVRQYASERLSDAGEGDDVRRRHADHFLALAEQAATFHGRPSQTFWLERLEGDHDDLRAALHWYRDHDRERWVRLALALAWFWLGHGHLGEGRQWLQGILAEPSLAPLDGHYALYWLARMAHWQGEYTLARELGERSLAIARELGENVRAGWLLSLLGTINTYAGDDERARACLEEVLATSDDGELRWDAEIGMSEFLLQRGDLGGARSHLERCLASATAPEDRWEVVQGVLFLAMADFFEGQHATAHRRVMEVLELYRQLGNPYGASAALYAAAGLAVAAGDPERALRLCSAAASERDAIRAPLAPRWQMLAQTVVVDPARAALDQEQADAAWAEGTRLSLDEAVAYALTDPAAAPAVRWEGARQARDGGVLSRREREVALLVARGLTNRQIANQLVIAERTVEGHVERIRGKLQARSRTQVAVWVVKQGWLADSRSDKL
jgi:predicted ATPase/DNA-binding CsgD family transcriptional regulator